MSVHRQEGKTRMVLLALVHEESGGWRTLGNDGREEWMPVCEAAART